MSYYTIAKGLTGKINTPDGPTPLSLAQEAVQQALGMIYDMTDWSFQRAITYANWLCPGNVANSGTYTVTPYQNQVIADAVATQVLLNLPSPPFVTNYQFRNPAYSIYNIIAYDNGQDPSLSPNFPYATLTLDRPWLEPTHGPGQPYMIYQVYYVAPVADFRKFIEVRDTTNSARLDFWSMTQAQLSIEDPQRTEFADPSYVVPAGIDQRPGSATWGYQMFELWPQQLSYIPYSFSYRRRGPIPSTAYDFMTYSTPYPITEEFLTWRAKETLFQDAAARMEGRVPGSGKGMMMLSQSAEKQSLRLFSEIL